MIFGLQREATGTNKYIMVESNFFKMQLKCTMNEFILMQTWMSDCINKCLHQQDSEYSSGWAYFIEKYILKDSMLLFFPDTAVRRWQSVMQNTWPLVSIVFRTALSMPRPSTIITPDTRLHDQSHPPAATNSYDIIGADASSSWSSYFYYCTILWC